MLESFYYVRQWQIDLIPLITDFLLDSGAYTFIVQKKNSDIDWLSYIDKYAEFIKSHNIRHFFELDIDKIIGLKEVQRLTDILENKVGAQCIPVFHKARGKDEFLSLIKRYKYIAIGGIVTKEIKKEDHYLLRWFTDKAAESGCKVHGLGYTPSSNKKVKETGFYSVDSTSWFAGQRFGFFGFLFKRTNKKSKTTKTRDAVKAGLEKMYPKRFERMAEICRICRKAVIVYRIKKRLEISASHRLELSYKSKCENIHGHNWIVAITLEAQELNEDGMVMDFTQIKKTIMAKLDHHNLNDVLSFNPTAENIARWICDELGDICKSVSVQESEGNIAEYIRD